MVPVRLLALLAAAVGDQRWYRDRGAALRLGTELYRSGRTSRLKEPLESAVRVLSRSIELSNAIEPGQAAAPHFYLGAALALLERDSEAEVAYHECIAQDPVAAVSAWHNLGSLYERALAWPSAADAYGHAVELAWWQQAREARQYPLPGFLNDLSSKGKTLYHAGDPDAAASTFSLAVRIANRVGLSWAERASLHYGWGRAIELHGFAAGHNTAADGGVAQSEAAASNFSLAMAIALNEGSGSMQQDRNTGSTWPVNVTISRGWNLSGVRDATREWLVPPSTHGEHYAAPHGQRLYPDNRGVALIGLGNKETAERAAGEEQSDADALYLCGNDAIILAPGIADATGRGRRVVFVPSHAEQIAWHLNLPTTLPRLEDTQTISQAVLLAQTFGVGYYHFVAEIVPRMLYARHSLPGVPMLIQSDEGGRLHSYVRRWLAMLQVGGAPPGGTEGELLYYEQTPHLARVDGATVRMAVRELFVIDWATTMPPLANTTAAAAAAADDDDGGGGDGDDDDDIVDTADVVRLFGCVCLCV